MWSIILLMLVIPDAGKFQPLAKNKDIAITILRDGDKAPWVRSEHTVPVPAKQVYDLLIQYDKYANTFGDSVETSKILSQSGSDTRLHLVWPLPFPMDDRDAIVKYQHRQDGPTYVIDWFHDHQQGDPSEGLRIEQVRGRTELIPTGTSTRIIYTYLADLGGDLPDFIKEASYTGEPEIYFNAIRSGFKLAPIAAP